MANFSIGRVLGIAVTIMVVIAVWKSNNGDVGNIIDGIWMVLNNGADILVGLWDRFVASGQLEQTLNGTSPTPAPSA